MKNIRGWVLVIAVFLFSSPSHARSLLNKGPLAEIDSVAVEVIVGDALGIEPDPGRPLFDGDNARAAQLKSDLTTAISEHLRSSGLQVAAKSDAGVQIGLFGGKFESSSSGAKNFFMVQASVCRPPRGLCTPERTVLGVVDDSSLSQTLIAAAVNIVDEFTANRVRWRESRH